MGEWRGLGRGRRESLNWALDEEGNHYAMASTGKTACRTKPSVQPITKEEQEYGTGQLGFPTRRQAADYWRPLSEVGQQEIKEWVEIWTGTIGEAAGPRTDEVKHLLYTWRELFVDDIKEMLPTDLVEHRILTYAFAKARTANPQLYDLHARMIPETRQSHRLYWRSCYHLRHWPFVVPLSKP